MSTINHTAKHVIDCEAVVVIAAISVP